MRKRVAELLAKHRSDVALALAVVVVAVLVNAWATGTLCAGSDKVYRSDDYWFESDVHIYFDSMTTVTKTSKPWTRVHPLFAPLGFVPTRALMALGLRPFMAIRTVMALTAGCWALLVFALLRALPCRRLDALLFSLVAVTSSAAIFWFSVPETYGFSSITILFALLLSARYGKEHRAAWYVAASAATLSITVTNWMFGLLATWTAWPWRRAVRLTLFAFVGVVAIWAVAQAAMPGMEFFLRDRDTSHFINHRKAGGPYPRTRALFVHSMVAPRFKTRPMRAERQLTVQQAAIGSTGPLGWMATCAWLALLGLGVVSMARGALAGPVRKVVAVALAGQWALHLVYGDETFLYTLHILPLLIVLAASSTLVRTRLLALSLAGVVLVTGSLNNFRAFKSAAEWMNQNASASIPKDTASPPRHGKHRR